MNPLHARIPLSYVIKNTWLNLSLDIQSFCELCFKGAAHRAIDGLCVSAHCRLRRIFTMKGPLMDTSDEHDSPMSPTSIMQQVETLPKSVEYPMGVTFSNQVYGSDKVGIDNSGEGVLALNAAGMRIEPGKTAKTSMTGGIAFGRHQRGNAAKAGGEEPAGGKVLGTAIVTAMGGFDRPRGFHATANEPFNKQQLSTTTSASTATTKRSVRAKGVRNAHEHALKTPDTKGIKSPLDIQTHDPDFPGGYQQHLKEMRNRDKSEPPPRKSQITSPKPPLENRRGSNVAANSAGKKRVGVKSASKSPQHKFGVGTREDKKKSRAQRLLVFDESAGGGSIQEQQAEDEDYGKVPLRNKAAAAMKKSDSEISLDRDKKKPPDNSSGKNNNNKVGGRRKPVVRAGKKAGGRKTVPPKAPADPSAMLLQQTVGGTQLNSFKIPGCNGPEEKEPTEAEIEEDIEGDDKQSTVSHRENDETPLYAGRERSPAIGREAY